jgi:hypothetical protein
MNSFIYTIRLPMSYNITQERAEGKVVSCKGQRLQMSF